MLFIFLKTLNPVKCPVEFYRGLLLNRIQQIETKICTKSHPTTLIKKTDPNVPSDTNTLPTAQLFFSALYIKKYDDEQIYHSLFIGIIFFH